MREEWALEEIFFDDRELAEVGNAARRFGFSFRAISHQIAVGNEEELIDTLKAIPDGVVGPAEVMGYKLAWYRFALNYSFDRALRIHMKPKGYEWVTEWENFDQDSFEMLIDILGEPIIKQVQTDTRLLESSSYKEIHNEAVTRLESALPSEDRKGRLRRIMSAFVLVDQEIPKGIDKREGFGINAMRRLLKNVDLLPYISSKVWCGEKNLFVSEHLKKKFSAAFLLLYYYGRPRCYSLNDVEHITSFSTLLKVLDPQGDRRWETIRYAIGNICDAEGNCVAIPAPETWFNKGGRNASKVRKAMKSKCENVQSAFRDWKRTRIRACLVKDD